MKISNLLALLLLFGFCACSSPQPDSSNADETQPPNSSPGPVDARPAAPQKPAAPPPPVLKALGLRTTGVIAANSPDRQWMYDCVEAARSGNYPALQQFIAPQKGFYFLHRPGVATSIDWLSQTAALKKTSWASFVQKFSAEKGAPLQDKDIYIAEPFRAVPEWQEDASIKLPPLATMVKGRFDYFSGQVEALVEYGFLDPQPEQRKRLDEVPDLVEMELLVDWVYYYFGQVAGEWRLIGLDVARCDFSA